MATSQGNKSTSSRSSSGASGRGGAAPKRASAAKKKKLTRQQIALRREIYAGVCAVIAVFCLLSLLKVQGFLLVWLQKLLSGAIGSGFVLLPFCLLFAAALFLVKRKGKVRLRVFCAMMLPILWGGAMHIFSCTLQFPLTVDGIVQLATSGAARQSGGLVAGTLAILLSKALSDAGAIVVVFLLGVVCLMVSTNTTLAMLFERVKNMPPEEEDEEPPRREKKRARPPEPEPAPAPQPVRREAEPPARPPMLAGLFNKGGKRIDIPLEAEAPKEYPKGEPIELSPPNVRTPDQVMGVEQQQSRPSTSVAEPNKTSRVPEPVIPPRVETGPVVSPAVLRAQEFAARKAAEAAQAVQAAQAPAAPVPTAPVSTPPAPAPAPQQAPAFTPPPAPIRAEAPTKDTLPWEEPSFVKPAEEDEAPPAVPASVASPALTGANPPAPPAAEPGAGEQDPAIAAAAALAAAQSPAESLGQEGPEWDAPDEAVNQQAQQALESALEAAPRDTYLYPPMSLLNKGTNVEMDHTQELAESSARLIDTLRSFTVEATLVDITRGPSVTRYEVQLKRGTKFSRVTNLSDDIALSLGAASVRIATIPDKLAVGIEVPNQQVELVPIRDIIDSKEFQQSKSRISFAVGKDITGHNVVGDIKKMPHMLIAGTTGSGKSVCINSLLISLIYKSTPEEVRLIMVDPKMIELGVYNGIPHLLIPVVTDPRKAAGALNWAVAEMMRRYKLFSEFNVRDLEAYNAEIVNHEGGQKLPQIVIVIDELADLMFVAASDVENAIVRIAQMARAAGMHLVIATQRPSADVITGIMKANIPSRISFAVASQIESRIILDTTGAEKLLGRGDMLYNPLGAPKPVRVQGCFITTAEIESVVEFVKKTGKPDYSEEVMEHIERQAENANQKGQKDGGSSGGRDDEEDEMMPRAIEVVVETGQASVSMLQRRLKLGYSRAARLVDQMAERGIVGPFEGSKPRQVLITREEWQEMVMRQQDL